jgi:hypothetical protein
VSPTCSSGVADAVGAVAPQAGQRGEVLPSGERGIQTRPIHEPRDPVRKSERPANRAAEDRQVAAVGLGQPEEQAQQRRLPGPVRSDQTMHLALRDVEVDAVKGDDLAKGFADPARTNCKRRRPAGKPAGRQVVMLFSQLFQFVSELGMEAPGTCDGA